MKRRACWTVSKIILLYDGEFLAERVGFEPTVGVNLHTLSKRAP
jgi:hypothetical protein